MGIEVDQVTLLFPQYNPIQFLVCLKEDERV